MSEEKKPTPSTNIPLFSFRKSEQQPEKSFVLTQNFTIKLNDFELEGQKETGTELSWIIINYIGFSLPVSIK